jgi:hypothetical protein
LLKEENRLLNSKRRQAAKDVARRVIGSASVLMERRKENL